MRSATLCHQKRAQCTLIAENKFTPSPGNHSSTIGGGGDIVENHRTQKLSDHSGIIPATTS